MTSYIPKRDSTTGASLTGSNGDENRTYTLSEDNSLSEGMNVIIQGTVLEFDVDYTFSSGVLTFVNRVFDAQTITIDYFVTQTPNGYSSTLNCVTLSGIGNSVFGETLGTGDSSADSFDFDNPHVIDDSYKLYYGASGSNNLTDMVINVDYTLDLSTGRVLLTATGVSNLGSNVLYADYVHSPKISDSELVSFLLAAEEEVNQVTGNYWGIVKSSTEYFDGHDTTKFASTDRPFASDYDEPDTLVVKNKSVQSVTSVDFLGNDGDSIRTLDNTYIDFYDYGEVILKSQRIPDGKKNVKVVYTHGYSVMNPLAKELTCLYVAIMSYAKITGGSYDDATSFSLGRKSASIGEVYVNVREAIKNYQNRIDVILLRLGPTMEVC